MRQYQVEARNKWSIAWANRLLQTLVQGAIKGGITTKL